MNYLTHGYRFLDDSLFVAGTAVPDWLRVVAPRVRARSRLVGRMIKESNDESFLRLCGGIMQHHADDDVFHGSIAFQQVSEDLARRFRGLMPDPCDHRPGLLGHVVTELLLDNELARRDPELLPRYYNALQSVDSVWVQESVNLVVPRPVGELAKFIDIFCEVRFLYDYADDDRLMMRLNQVLKRIPLAPLESDSHPVFNHGRQLITQQADVMLGQTAGENLAGEREA
ncbi:MAG: hypothetical protein MK102_16335 [Fuerstiella sp.]|nr:hypothetical protein [Fuerstiella sp.]